MHVQSPVVEHAVVDAEACGVRSDVFEGEHGRLLHHVAEVARKGEFCRLAAAHAGLDKENFAAYGRPCQARHNASVVVALIFVAAIDRFAQEAADVCGLQFLHALRRFFFALHGAFESDFAVNLAYLLLELAHSTFARVLFNNMLDALGREFQAAGKVFVIICCLAWYEMAAGNFFLLLREIAFHFDYLHAVKQRCGNGLQTVGRGDEEHVGKVVVEVEEVVVKGGVLLGVEHFEQGALRVAVDVAVGHLVNLVEHKHGVVRAGFDEAFHDASGHCADVGAAVSAYLRLVVNAAERHAHVFAPNGLGNAAAERCLAHARRPVQAKYRGAAVAAVEQRGEVFENALLHALHAEVVLVEHAARGLDVEFVFREFTPGQRGYGLEIVELHVVVGVLRRDTVELVDFLVEQGTHLFRKVFPREFLAQFLRVLVLAFAQFVLDILDLLLQEIFLLLLVEFLARLVLNVAFESGELAGAVQEREQGVGTLHVIVDGQEAGLFFQREGQVGAEEVDGEDVVLDVADSEDGLLVLRFSKFEEAHGRVAAFVHERGVFLAVGRGQRVGQAAHVDARHGGAARDLPHLAPPEALQDHGGNAAGQFQHAHHARRHGYGVEVAFVGLLHGGVFLCGHGK